MSDYFEKFSKLADFKLIEIVANKGDYDHKAVKAAEFELQRRNIDDTEINTITEQLKVNMGERELPQINMKPLNDRLIVFTREFTDVVKPYGKKSLDQLIKIFGLLFFLNGLILFRTFYRYVDFFLVNGMLVVYGLEFVVITLTLATCFFAGIQLWKLNRRGWIAGMILIVHLIILQIIVLTQLIHTRLTFDYTLWNFPKPQIGRDVIHLALLFGVLVFMYRKTVRERMGISSSFAASLVGWTLLASVVYMYVTVIHLL